MEHIKVKILQEPSVNQLGLITEAAKLTQKRGHVPGTGTMYDFELTTKLIKLGHTSLLEYANLTVFVENASRVFLSQITRHRLASFTSQSQQYQKHHGFTYLVPDCLSGDLLHRYDELMGQIDEMYEDIEGAHGRDIARYVLPGATHNNLLISANLREWMTAILPQRLCHRNTLETQYIMREICRQANPELSALFMYTGPACWTKGACDQGNMACSEGLVDMEEAVYRR